MQLGLQAQQIGPAVEQLGGGACLAGECAVLGLLEDADAGFQ